MKETLESDITLDYKNISVHAEQSSHWCTRENTGAMFDKYFRNSENIIAVPWLPCPHFKGESLP